MDTTLLPKDRLLLEAALDAVRAMGLTAQLVQEKPALGRTHADALVRLTNGDQEILYAIELKRAVKPATLGALLHQIERLGKQALVATDYVTPQVADALKARGVPFIDTAGNAYLNNPGLFVWVKGQKPEAQPIAPELGRAFQATGLQVLFTLLCDPQAVNRPYRTLANMAGVAHGTVGWVMQDLQQLGFVGDIKGKRKTRRLFQTQRLLTQWTDAYARLLRPRTLIGRFYVPTLEGWREWPIKKYKALWGGEPAAALLTEYLRPGELTLYAEKLPGPLVAQQKLLRAPEPGHMAAVEIRRRFWNFAGDPAQPDITPPLLVYADLLATGDGRCIETAKMVYEAYVARLFEND